jgi:hypothetical protein
MGYASVFQAEATGLKIILLWTSRRNIHALQVDGDSKLIFNTVQDHSQVSWRVSTSFNDMNVGCKVSLNFLVTNWNIPLGYFKHPSWLHLTSSILTIPEQIN